MLAGLFALLLAVASTVAGAYPAALTPTASPVRLFVDDFETYSNRWRVVETPKAGVAYQDGALWFRISSPGMTIWSAPDFSVPLADYRLEVTATVHAAAPDAWVGVVVRFASDERFYGVALWPGGDWALLRRDGDSWVSESYGNGEPFAALQAGSPLTMTVDVNRAAVALAVDGSPLGDIPYDSSEFEGGFGLIAYSGKGYLDVSFDDVMVIGSSRP